LTAAEVRASGIDMATAPVGRGWAIDLARYAVIGDRRRVMNGVNK
jgi:hypothetical protein